MVVKSIGKEPTKVTISSNSTSSSSQQVEIPIQNALFNVQREMTTSKKEQSRPKKSNPKEDSKDHEDKVQPKCRRQGAT